MEFKGNSMIENFLIFSSNNYVTSVTDIKLLPDFNDNLIREKNTGIYGHVLYVIIFPVRPIHMR